MKNFKIDKVEKYILITSTTFIIIIFFFNYYLNYHRQYNFNYINNKHQCDFYFALPQDTFVKLKLIGQNNYPDLEVLINGEFFKSFNMEKELLVFVENGDVIHINGTMYHEEIKIEVIETSHNIKQKENIIGNQIVINGNIRFLCLIPN